METSCGFISRATGFVAVVLLSVPALCLAQSTPTTTALSISPSGSVSAGTVVTLTAAVNANGHAVSPGLVVFCNAAAPHCEDSAVLGQAQLTSAGVATLRLRPGIGSHSVKAVFQGTPHTATPMAGSASAAKSLTVTGAGSYATATTITVSGLAGNYNFTGMVNTFGRVGPGGTVSFLDATNGNSSLGSASLNAAPVFGFAMESSPTLIGNMLAAATGDFNNDGIPDVAALQVEGVVNGSAAILLGKGDGTFTVKSSPAVGPYPTWVVSADFNSDGISDLAVTTVDATSTDNGMVTILLGNGDGTFITKPSPKAGLFPYSMTVADFNGDGIPDLAAVNSGDADPSTNNVTILLGNGDGTFKPAASPVVGLNPYYVVTADFNGDGIPDLATANVTDDTVTILLGNGDGTFALKSSPSVGDYSSITVGDFNNDGMPDLVAVGYRDDSMTILLGNGDGTFTTKSNSFVGSNPTGTIAQDFDGDGNTDLAVVLSGNNTVSFLSGNGDGTFTARSISSTGRNPLMVATADFNGDGIPDLVTANEADLTDSILLGELSTTGAINNIALHGGGNHNIVASYSGDASHLSSESAPLSINNMTPPPVFSPIPGIYQWTQKVVISTPAAGAAIYYTLDGSKPSAASAKYTAPIAVTWQDTINAIAVFPNSASSSIVAGTYTIDRPVQPPIFNPPAGTYRGPLTITLTPNPIYCEYGACDLYYTINGAGYVRYTGPFTISRIGTNSVKAIATEWHYTTSTPITVLYTIK